MELLFLLVLFELPICFGMGLIFKKMGLEFKYGVIPFYNKIILIKRYKLPQYHLIFIFIPLLFIYTNFLINKGLVKENNRNSIDILKLTFLPFIFNILFALDLNEKSVETEKVDSKEKLVDDYYWYPKQKIKSDTVYKASRNKMSAKVDIKISNNNEIIDNKKQVKLRNGDNMRVCPKCGAKVSSNLDECYICGTRL